MMTGPKEQENVSDNPQERRDLGYLAIHPLGPEDSAAIAALRNMVAGTKGKLEGTAARRASRLRPMRSGEFPAGGRGPK
jgi:hypothetical protein